MKYNRFKNEREVPPFNMAVPVISFAVIFGVFYLAISSLADNTGIQQRQTLENAVNRDILHCFASEGEYPESIEYLEENYALTYDHDKFEIEYIVSGDNKLPSVKVLVK